MSDYANEVSVGGETGWKVEASPRKQAFYLVNPVGDYVLILPEELRKVVSMLVTAAKRYNEYAAQRGLEVDRV